MSEIVEVSVLERDLENLHSTLTAVRDHLQAYDLFQCSLTLGDPMYSPLTTLVDARLQRVTGILKDHYAAQRLADLDGVIEEPEEAEPEEELPSLDPIMKIDVKPLRKPLEFTDDGEDDES